MGETVGLHHAQWDTWYMSGTVPSLLGLWDRRDSGITPCTVGRVQDFPCIPGTLRTRHWDGKHSSTLKTVIGPWPTH